MLFYPKCDWRGCRESAEVKCMCKDPPFIGCSLHFAHHLRTERHKNHQNCTLMLPISDQEINIIETAYRRSSFPMQLRSLVDQRSVRLRELYQQIQIIEQEFQVKIEQLMKKETEIVTALNNIRSAKIIPSVSENQFVCKLARLKENSNLTLKSISEMMKLNPEQSAFAPRIPAKSINVSSLTPSNSISKYQNKRKQDTITGIRRPIMYGEIIAHSDEVRALDFSPDGKYIASASADSFIRVWDIQTKNKVHEFRENSAVNSICFMPNGRELVSGGDDQVVHIWNLHGWISSKMLRGQDYPIKTVAVSRNGNMIASGGIGAVIDLWINNVHRTLIGHSDSVSTIKFTADDCILSGSSDRSIILWNPQQSTPLTTISTMSADVNSLSLSTCGKFFVSASSDGTLIVWDIRSFNNLSLMRIDSNPYCVSYSPDGKSIISVDSNGDISAWDPLKRQLQYYLGKNNLKLFIGKYSRCGKYIASGGEDKYVRLWKFV